MQPASKIGHPSKGAIWLTVNGKQTQKGDLTELIWSVPEIIWQLSQQVKLAAGDIIMTGTPAGVSQLHPGDKIECGVDGVGKLKVAIGQPEKQHSLHPVARASRGPEHPRRSTPRKIFKAVDLPGAWNEYALRDGSLQDRRRRPKSGLLRSQSVR